MSKIIITHTNNRAKRNDLVEKYIETDKFRMKYWIGGEGAPLLLVHGFGYGAAFNWYPQIKDFTKKYKLIIPDLLNFGASESYIDNYSLELQAEAIASVLEKEKIDTLNIVAHSYGGFVAFNYYRTNSDKIKKFIVINSPFLGITDQYIDSVENELSVESLADVVVPRNIDEVKMLYKLFYGRETHAPKFLLKDLHENVIYHKGDEKRKILTYLLNHNVPKEYNFKKNDELILIWGKKDIVFKIDLAYQLEKQIGRNTPLYIFEEEGHAPQVENARKFNKLCLSLLEDK